MLTQLMTLLTFVLSLALATFPTSTGEAAPDAAENRISSTLPDGPATAQESTPQAQEAGQDDRAATPPADQRTPPPAPENVRTADDLLTLLEAADRDLRSFTAAIRYTKEQGLIGDVQIRRGRVLAVRDPGSGRLKFAVKFNQHILGSSVHERAQDFIFDGFWLVERDNTERSFVKRQIVDPAAPADAFDPFAIDGPFPLPVGQNRAAVLARFDAELLESAAEGRLQNAWHLKLTPKSPKAQDETLERVDLWYDRDTRLPIKAILVESGGDEISTVELATIERNAAVEEAIFDTTPPSAEERRREGWSVTIVPLQTGPAPGSDAGGATTTTPPASPPSGR